ncbi:uncharacterized protein LOC120628561 [Pararge aegeria]|uniref:uncharacterized protein LOC120628561 n=1 Tax=Pararge aegeria TaxID=116150 RepID=UPI0019D16024|nr:uncharacterized protein LOC120628561 [Pararge aegeria]
MSFELGEPKQVEEAMYYERKAPPERGEEYSSEIGAHKDLFETISEAHYLPELGGPHDEELLESLVEKGCEDNQILVDQALDKLSQLVHGSGEYNVEDDMLLSDAPVSDIMNRLEQTLESPGQSSITAAQGLLHLHHIGDHLSQANHSQVMEQSYMSEEVFVPEDTSQCPMESLAAAATELQEMNEMNHMEYDENVDKRLESDIGNVHAMCTEQVPDSLDTETEIKTYHELQSQSLPDQSEINTPIQTADDVTSNECLQNCEQICANSEDEHNLGPNEEEIQKVTIEPTQDNSNDDHDEESANEDMVPTDLSIKSVEKSIAPLIRPCDTHTPHLEDNMSVKNEEQPRDLTVHRRLPTPQASPRRIELPRAPSRESDAMQSPQPSGIPAVPSSPEIFTMPLTKSKQTLFLETLLSSPSPKMYTSEVTITKQQCEPLNLGKHRKSASPTVSSCSDEIKKVSKDFGEPQEKKLKRESNEELAKVSKVFKTEDHVAKKPELKIVAQLPIDEPTPLKQLLVLKSNPELNIPDPLLVPKDKLNAILIAPGREIPALLLQRPELRLPQALAYPSVLQDPDILVVSLAQIETILENEELKSPSPRPPKEKDPKSITSSKNSEKSGTPQPDQTNQPKPIPSMDALAGDIDAATSAALNQMLWLPYLSQLEAMAACSQNMDFLKALNSAGYTGQNYPDISQMFNHSNRYMPPGGFPMMPPMDYDNRLQFAMWQEAMSHASATHRSKQGAMAEQMKELSKSTDVQNPYVHSTKNHPTKTHSSARTSPIAHNYNNQRGMAHHPFLQGMYPGMNPNIRPNMPLPGLQIPYFNPQMMGNQRSPRTGQQKSPSSPFYPNNNYLQSVKQSESQNHQRNAPSQESPRPRISVKSLHNLLEPSAAAASGVGSSRRTSTTPTSVMGRRRDEPEVGSTTTGEPTPHMPPHPHDPSSFHLWHPLFGNQKSYNSPWSWTTVTATGD